MSDKFESQEELLETPVVEAVAATTAAGVATASAFSAATTHPPTAPALSKAQLIGGALVMGISLLFSLSALWMGMSLGTQIDVINQNVGELQLRVLNQSRRGSPGPEVQLGDQLNRLGERVNELAVIVEGPVGHLRESNQKALEALNLRLERLENGPGKRTLSDMPVAGKAKIAATATVPQTIPKKSRWVINLLSVASVKAANSELTRLRSLGIRADKQTVSDDGKTWYRLRVAGFNSYEGAKAYIDTVQQQTGFKSAWVAME